MKNHEIALAWRLPRPVAFGEGGGGPLPASDLTGTYTAAAERRLKGVLEAVYIREEQIPGAPSAARADLPSSASSAADDARTQVIPLVDVSPPCRCFFVTSRARFFVLFCFGGGYGRGVVGGGRTIRARSVFRLCRALPASRPAEKLSCRSFCLTH